MAGRAPWLNPANWLIALVAGYRRAVSPWLPPSCRFTPTCSEYAMEALKTRGLWVGFWLTVWRLMRCQPFGKPGYDPVPPVKNKEKTGEIQ